MLQLAFAALLSLVFAASSRFSEHAERWHHQLLGFSSGMLIAIIFAEILPLLSAGFAAAGDIVFLFMLLGFLVYHLIEKHTYQHSRGLRQKHELDKFHIAGFFVENVVNGFVLAVLIESGVSLLIFLPFLLVTVAISLSLRHMDDRFRLGRARYVLSLSVLAGAVLATLLHAAQLGSLLLLALTSGFLLYFVVRDMIPQGKDGRPGFFLAGIILALAVLMLVKVV